LALASIFVILITFLFLASSEEKDLERFKALNYSSVFKDENLLDVIKNINEKLLLLENDAQNAKLHDDVFETIISSRGDVKITGLVYEIDKKNKMNIRVQGESPTREKLFGFIKALEELGFKEINSPVSNYVKDKDIPFFLKITL